MKKIGGDVVTDFWAGAAAAAGIPSRYLGPEQVRPDDEDFRYFRDKLLQAIDGEILTNRGDPLVMRCSHLTTEDALKLVDECKKKLVDPMCSAEPPEVDGGSTVRRTPSGADRPVCESAHVWQKLIRCEPLPLPKKSVIFFDDLYHVTARGGQRVNFEEDAVAVRKRDGLCPRCGDAGEWRAMALVCRNGHGTFVG